MELRLDLAIGKTPFKGPAQLQHLPGLGQQGKPVRSICRKNVVNFRPKAIADSKLRS